MGTASLIDSAMKKATELINEVKGINKRLDYIAKTLKNIESNQSNKDKEAK